MNGFVLDTSAYSHFMRGDPQVVELVDSSDWLGMPAVVLGELEVGFLLGTSTRLAENRATLGHFMANPVVEELGLDHEGGRIYAEILVSLRRAGTKIPSNDIWIAAVAARHGSTVLTYDRHFEAVRRVGSRILDPPAATS